MVADRNALLELYRRNAGKTVHVPKIEPSAIQLVGYQYPRTDRFQLRVKE